MREMKEAAKPRVHLFFDVFVEDAEPGKYLRGDLKRFEIDKSIREADSQYRYQTKFDITRYSIASYADVGWESATFRIECEAARHRTIYDEVSALFPYSTVEESRSDTSEKFVSALLQLKERGARDDDWVFFCPNNDHPLLASPEELHEFIEVADRYCRAELEEKICGLAYSHFSEGLNANAMTKPQWGYYGDCYAKRIYESEKICINKLSRLAIDSVMIYSLEFLISIFQENKQTGRCIRTEDTSKYLNKTDDFYVAVPKVELCRHYDGYSHIIKKVPPMFIPQGFFSKNIKIKIGKEREFKDQVLVNPEAKHYSYEDSSGADLICYYEEVPHFWKQRIIECVGELGLVQPHSEALKRAMDLKDPFRERPVLFNLIRSVCVFIRNKIKILLIKIKSMRET